MPPEQHLPAPVTCAVVLAGGLGTRLRSAVPDLPKPMAPVAGRPFLEHLLEHWIARGVQTFVLCVGYRHEAIVNHFGRQWHGAELRYSIENEPLGTGGALRLAADQLDPARRFLLLNGDTWFDVDLVELVSLAAAQDADWCFSLFRHQEAGPYLGMALDVDGRIVGMGTGRADAGLANGGVYLVHPRSLLDAPAGPASLENDFFPTFLAAGQRFFGLESAGCFIDIGLPADFLRASQVLPTAASDGPTHSPRV